MASAGDVTSPVNGRPQHSPALGPFLFGGRGEEARHLRRPSLRVAFGELGHHAVFLPDLNVVTVNKLLARLDVCGVVRATQIYSIDKVAVPIDDVRSIIGHA